MQTYPEDNSDKVFRAKSARETDSETLRHLRMLRDPGQFKCPECNGETFYIIADQAPTGLMVIQCTAPRCGRLTKPLEIHVPQMDDSKAKALGLHIPDRHGPSGTIDFDL